MTAPQLDHIVILLPYADIVNPPRYITDHFTISPGGRHGDNKTENKLVVFADGSYLEFIAFIDDNPAHREGHYWGDKGYGIIDFAFTLPGGAEAFPDVQRKLQGLDIPEQWKPQALTPGSRLKPSGDLISWLVSYPQRPSRGKLPFWCFDSTPRPGRVSDSSAATTHPSGARGIGAILITLPEEDASTVARAYDGLFGAGAGAARTGEGRGDVVGKSWKLDTVRALPGFGHPRVVVEEVVRGGSEVVRGRQLVARLEVWSDGDEPWEIREEVHGDVLRISSQAEK